MDYRRIFYRMYGTEIIGEKIKNAMFSDNKALPLPLSFAHKRQIVEDLKRETKTLLALIILPEVFLQAHLFLIMFNSPVSIPHLIVIFFGLGTFVFFLLHRSRIH